MSFCCRSCVEALSSSLSLINFFCLLGLPLLVLAALGRLLFLAFAGGRSRAGPFFRRVLLAALPQLLTLLLLLWTFLNLDPLWPAQDPTPEIQQAYALEKERADWSYGWGVLLNIPACLCFAFGLVRAWWLSRCPAPGK